MPVVALATCREFPLLDDEDRRLLPALATLGVEAVPAVWTDASVDWSGFDAVVIRETWDYSIDHDAFLDWIDRVAAVTALFNGADLVRWNTDKRYLGALADAGVPTAPTRFLEPGADARDWRPAGWIDGDVVVKPAVSCGSRDTALHRAPDDEAGIVGHVQGLLDDGRVVMVQPYLDAVDTAGETALMYVDGVFSHAIRKGPMLMRGVESERVEGLFVQEQIDPREPTAAELAVGEHVMRAIPGTAPLYARVDLIPGPDGAPMLLELELTEPSLFFSHATGSAERLAAAIAGRLG